MHAIIISIRSCAKRLIPIAPSGYLEKEEIIFRYKLKSEWRKITFHGTVHQKRGWNIGKDLNRRRSSSCIRKVRRDDLPRKAGILSALKKLCSLKGKAYLRPLFSRESLISGYSTFVFQKSVYEGNYQAIPQYFQTWP